MKKIFTLLLSCCYASFLFSQTNFSEVATDVGIETEYLNLLTLGGGAAFFDYNQDGWEDVWIARGVQQDKLYKNNGDGTFTAMDDITAPYASVNTMGVVTADLNNNGYRDVLLITLLGLPNVLLQNNGDGTFTDITFPSGIGDYAGFSMAASFGDVNMDGLLDIYVGNYIYNPVVDVDSLGNVINIAHNCDINWLFINKGMDENDMPSFELTTDPTFTADIGCTLATTFTDFDSDLDPDIFVVNDFGAWIVPNRLLMNNGPGDDFSDVGMSANMSAQMEGTGVSIGDYDQDGDLDYYACNVGSKKLFQNNGSAGFSEQAAAAGVEDTYANSDTATLYTVGWGTFFADVDNDTDLDLFVANGFALTLAESPANPMNPNRLFLNQMANTQQPTFIDYTVESGSDNTQKARGCSYADYDNDGDLDYMVVNTNAGPDVPEPVLLYRNDLGTDNNWLQFKLVGQMTNRDAFGTQIRIVVGTRSWRVEIDGGSSHVSQNSSIAHFGLGAATVADSIIVYWPRSETQVFTNIPGNQRITLVEGESIPTSVSSPAADVFQMVATPNPFSNYTTLSYELTEATELTINAYTITGKLVETFSFTKPKGAHQFNWNTSQLTNGLYLLRLQTEDGQEQSLRVMKQ